MPPLDIPKPAAAAPATSSERFGDTESTFSTALIPGVGFAAVIASAAVLAEALIRRWTGGFELPALVIALLAGMALAAPARRVAFTPGLVWCVKTLLRIAIAMLGLRVSLADIVGLGLGTVGVVVAAMALTICASISLSGRLGLGTSFGALAGAANAVCGASAALATSTVLPSYDRKSADVAFAVIAANAVSTIAMLIYPLVAALLGYGPQATGILLGATIHDVAQVVGAGYAVSERVGNAAVIVKLFRVFLLLPVVLGIGWWLAAGGTRAGTAKVPVPMFAVVFLSLCVVNTAAMGMPALAPLYVPVKAVLDVAASWGLLLAIAALGAGTSVAELRYITWRHGAVFLTATAAILLAVAAGLWIVRS
ncbi:MAG: putative sulfate exporter family transporter [Xanthobacteraceae bacterium]|nr:putative sulfate exporter family transporter [Xanthobacteraceae bacterium]